MEAPCTCSQLTAPPGTAILHVGNKSWKGCSKWVKVTYVTHQMQNIYPVLKCNGHREQQERDWQVSRPLTQGVQAPAGTLGIHTSAGVRVLTVRYKVTQAGAESHI